MFDIITKKDLFQVLDRKRISDANPSLKNIQDGFAVDWLIGEIGTSGGKNLIEMGGGNSRVARRVAAWDNKITNVDKFEGVGAGPIEKPDEVPYEIINSYIGDFSEALLDSSYDIIYSISVVEHVPLNRIGCMMRDCARLLRKGGKLLHLIDTYMFDCPDFAGADYYSTRIKEYLKPIEGLEFIVPPALNPCSKFSCEYATNSPFEMWRWKIKTKGERINHWREIGQGCSIKAVWAKI